MKGIAQLIGVLAVLFIVLTIITPKSDPKPQTKYHECIDTAKHLRSDADTKAFTDTICERLPVEAGDYR